jgi:hypothetical protein
MQQILTNPRLRGTNVVSNSFSSCIPDATEEFSWTPEMSFSEIIFEPRMLFHQTESTISFEKLKGFANAHRRRDFNKDMDVVCSDMQFINLALFSVSNLSQEKFTIHPQSIKLKGISCIFNFPDKMESVLSEAMLSRFQIHYLSPEHSSNYIRKFISKGLVSRPSHIKKSKKLNFEDGDSSPNLKVRVSSPWM